MLLGILAVNLDLPLCVFLLDASETNYSGFRGAIDQARQRWREVQSWMMGLFHGPVYEWKVRQWAVTDSRSARPWSVPILSVRHSLPLPAGVGKIPKSRQPLETSHQVAEQL